MKTLNQTEVQEVNGAGWPIAIAVVYVVSAIAKGYNEAHHEHC